MLKSDLLADIRGLSSGTISSVVCDEFFRRIACRQNWTSNKTLGVDPNQAKDSWVVDQVQSRFHLFCESSEKAWDCWQACWNDYLKEIDQVRFRCTYCGECDWTYRGTEYQERCFGSLYAKEHSYNAGVWESDIFPAIGTVRFEHCAYKGFPPAILTSLCPCYVPSMWSMDLHALVYQNGFGTPMTGIGICKDPCSYLHDAKFEHSVEQWEEWRRFASKKHGGDWRDAA